MISARSAGFLLLRGFAVMLFLEAADYVMLGSYALEDPAHLRSMREMTMGFADLFLAHVFWTLAPRVRFSPRDGRRGAPLTARSALQLTALVGCATALIHYLGVFAGVMIQRQVHVRVLFDSLHVTPGEMGAAVAWLLAILFLVRLFDPRIVARAVAYPRLEEREEDELM